MFNVNVRLALVGFFCNLPASRKVCGFCSFNAFHGCNKCMKEFQTESFGESPDYSGYGRTLWSTRDVVLHREKSDEHLNADTKHQQKLIEKVYGIRYSVLTKLPYFNPIRHTIIDPMHNLFLGTAKHCMELWTKKEISNRRDIERIEKEMSQLYAPHSAGRLPLKVGTGFSGFTADQWRNWTIGYSPVVLQGVLPREHLQYWLLFVKACSLLCTPCLLKKNVELADKYLHMFCSQFLEVNGRAACTPNMHLHLHLKECLYDYGPLYAFWCYAFERYNGMLGNFPTNQKNIEPQLMRKCLILQELHSQVFPIEGECFESLLVKHSPSFSGGLMMSMTGENILDIIKLSTPALDEGLDYSVTGYEKCLPPIRNAVLNTDMITSLQLTYKLLYPDIEINSLQRFVKQSSRVSFAGEILGSKAASRDNNTIITAHWPSCSTSLSTPGGNFPVSVGQIQFF